jgi:hypothetical protein
MFGLFDMLNGEVITGTFETVDDIIEAITKENKTMKSTKMNFDEFANIICDAFDITGNKKEELKKEFDIMNNKLEKENLNKGMKKVTKNSCYGFCPAYYVRFVRHTGNGTVKIYYVQNKGNNFFIGNIDALSFENKISYFWDKEVVESGNLYNKEIFDKIKEFIRVKSIEDNNSKIDVEIRKVYVPEEEKYNWKKIISYGFTPEEWTKYEECMREIDKEKKDKMEELEKIKTQINSRYGAMSVRKNNTLNENKYINEWNKYKKMKDELKNLNTEKNDLERLKKIASVYKTDNKINTNKYDNITNDFEKVKKLNKDYYEQKKNLYSNTQKILSDKQDLKKNSTYRLVPKKLYVINLTINYNIDDEDSAVKTIPIYEGKFFNSIEDAKNYIMETDYYRLSDVAWWIEETNTYRASWETEVDMEETNNHPLEEGLMRVDYFFEVKEIEKA